MTDLFRYSASEIAHAVRTRIVSAEAVTQAHLDRADQVNPSINAIVQDCRAEALSRAREIDADIAKGVDPGPLAGVPVTIKVNVDQQGHATTNGLRLLKDNVASHDSPLVSNMRKAGAVFVGRTNTPAFSIRWFTKNELSGQTLNPRNAALTPGGSSGGAAAAVAAGLCPIGHGTDIAGSVRYPAYACGVHGLRPTLGRIPAYNASGPDRYIGAQLMAVSGPIARSIADIALSLQVMSMPDPRDPWYTPAPDGPRPYVKRAALCLEPDGMAVAEPVKDALRQAASALQTAGWQVDEVPCPPMRDPARINAVLWMAETQISMAQMIADEGDRDAQFVFDLMKRDVGPIEPDTVMTALQRRATLIRAWQEFLVTYPLLLCPVSGELPFDQQSDVASEADFMRIYEAQLTQRGLPVIGIPGLAVATGAAQGRPVGVQLVSDKFREDILIEAGAVIEAASPKQDVADPIL